LFRQIIGAYCENRSKHTLLQREGKM